MSHEKKHKQFNLDTDKVYAAAELNRLPAYLRSRVEVTADGHFRWTAGCNNKGYGLVCIPRANGGPSTVFLCRRLIFHQCVRKLQRGEKVVNHCKFRDCLRPSHMLSGSHQTVKEMSMYHGDYATGKSNSQTKLTAGEVRTIRKLKEPPYIISNRRLSQIFNVSTWAIHAVHRRKMWSWLV